MIQTPLFSTGNYSVVFLFVRRLGSFRCGTRPCLAGASRRSMGPRCSPNSDGVCSRVSVWAVDGVLVVSAFPISQVATALSRRRVVTGGQPTRKINLWLTATWLVTIPGRLTSGPHNFYEMGPSYPILLVGWPFFGGDYIPVHPPSYDVLSHIWY